MTKGWRRNANTNGPDYIRDFKRGISIRSMSRKYGVMKPTIKAILVRDLGFIGFSKTAGCQLTSYIRSLYETKFIDIANGIVDECGASDLAGRLGISYQTMCGMLQDLLTNKTRERLFQRKYLRFYSDDFKEQVKKAYAGGMTFSKIRYVYRINYHTIDKILKDEL